MAFFTTQGTSVPSVFREIVFYFILFRRTPELGGGQLFIDMAYSVNRRAPRESAKASVISSALLWDKFPGALWLTSSWMGIFTIP